MISFELNLKEWENIRPDIHYDAQNDKNKPAINHPNKRRMPKNKWTDFMREFIWKKTSNKCSWAFKTNTAKDGYSVNAYGYCKECKGTIRICTEKKVILMY